MTLLEKIVNTVKKILGVEKLIDNPNSARYTFIGDEETVRIQHLEEYKVWGLVADSDELDNFYKGRKMGGYQKEPIFNANKRQYFWALAENETQGIKKIHTGIPKAAVTTLVNCLQDVKITCEGCQDKIDAILETNNFSALLNQESRPITLVEGDGAFKIVFNKDLCKHPLIQFYEAEDVDYVVKSGVLCGIIYRDFYKYQGKNYVLVEVRRREEGNSIIEYQLYRLNKQNEVIEVPLETIPELAGLENLIIPGLDEVLGVRSIYFKSILNKNRGESILAGKIDIADDMDMLASVESMTEKNSSPMEYYPVDLLKKDKNNRPELPKVFGRKFIKKPVVPNADGQEDGKIDVSAPQLNFQQYHDALINKTLVFLSGMLAPASMGIDIAKKDNAEAQREKEKVTIMTRDNIVANECEQLKDLMRKCLLVQEYMDTGNISIRDYDISVKYSDFASPTFETMSGVLTPMLSAGAISSKMFVDKLYGDTLSDEEKQFEINEIDRKDRESSLGDMFGNDSESNMGESEEEPEAIGEFAK